MGCGKPLGCSRTDVIQISCHEELRLLRVKCEIITVSKKNLSFLQTVQCLKKIFYKILYSILIVIPHPGSRGQCFSLQQHLLESKTFWLFLNINKGSITTTFQERHFIKSCWTTFPMSRIPQILHSENFQGRVHASSDKAGPFKWHVHLPSVWRTRLVRSHPTPDIEKYPKSVSVMWKAQYLRFLAEVVRMERSLQLYVFFLKLPSVQRKHLITKVGGKKRYGGEVGLD